LPNQTQFYQNIPVRIANNNAKFQFLKNLSWRYSEIKL